MWEAAFKWEGREGDFTERETGRVRQRKTNRKRHTHKQNKEDLETQPGFPGGSAGKETPCNARGPSFLPGSGRFPGGGNGNPL